MTSVEFARLIHELASLPQETEWIEFKCDNKNPEKIGEYLSALSNSAALLEKTSAYLVWGIDNDTHQIVGTNFKPRREKKGNEEIENWLAHHLTPRIDFTILEGTVDDHDVVAFEVQPARSQPTSFKNTEFIRVGSYKKKLKDHPEKERRLWSIFNQTDWSAQIVEGATLDDLDPDAIEKARREYKQKYPTKADDVDSWDDTTFLNKAKVTIRGQITNAAILLLGREESATLISPAVAQITWFLKNEKNENKDYEHFGPPFLVNVERLFARVRNLKVRHLPSGTLFPMETTQYDTWVIREALHNCIAHQDYSLKGRVNVVEFPSELLFTNVGSFLPGTVEAVIEEDAPPEVYRNPFLCAAMVNLNMIDTQGGGIKKMFQSQMKRYFPMPSYKVDDPERVEVRIHGEILDERYTKLLMQKADLDLWTAILLDKVQKRVRIDKETAKELRGQKLIEGRYPNLFVSAKVASAVGEKAEYVKNRGLDDNYYANLVVEHIKSFGHITREEANHLLVSKLPDILDEKQKMNKINRLLSVILRGKIKNVGSKRYSKYVLV